jgi:hypothetical protein
MGEGVPAAPVEASQGTNPADADSVQPFTPDAAELNSEEPSVAGQATQPVTLAPMLGAVGTRSGTSVVVLEGEVGNGIVGGEGDDVDSGDEEFSEEPAYIPSRVLDAGGALPGAVNRDARKSN